MLHCTHVPLISNVNIGFFLQIVVTVVVHSAGASRGGGLAPTRKIAPGRGCGQGFS